MMTSENCDLSTPTLTESLTVRVNNISSTECLEKASFGTYESQNKKAFEAQTPRPPLAASNSCNDTLKNNSGRCKRPSMIPKSKSIKRTDKGNVKIEMPVQSEEVCVVWNSNKKQLPNKTELEPDEPGEITTKKPKQSSPLEEVKADDVNCRTPVTKTESKEETKQPGTETSSVSLKSCLTAIDIDYEESANSGYSATSTKSQISEYGDAEEELNNPPAFNHEFAEGEKGDEEKEAGKHERGIQTLYETLKSTGSMFDNFKYLGDKNTPNVSTEDWPGFTVQKCYDVTLEDVSDIWKNTMSLISSVKDHAVKYIEKTEPNFLDREQLLLEGEMVQLAIDFAVNYSKLKTDFLIKSVSERLGVKNLMKTSLEGFMDSKTFPALYNDDDLATMSRTIKDLNSNVLKEEDLEVR